MQSDDPINKHTLLIQARHNRSTEMRKGSGEKSINNTTCSGFTMWQCWLHRRAVCAGAQRGSRLTIVRVSDRSQSAVRRDGNVVDWSAEPRQEVTMLSVHLPPHQHTLMPPAQQAGACKATHNRHHQHPQCDTVVCAQCC